MRIAQVAPLAESVPPKLYGGTERVVAWLVEELVELGHKITLFASGDSQTKADLILFAPVPCAWGSRVQIRWPHRRPCSKRWQEEQTNSTSSTLTSTGFTYPF